MNPDDIPTDFLDGPGGQPDDADVAFAGVLRRFLEMPGGFYRPLREAAQVWLEAKAL